MSSWMDVAVADERLADCSRGKPRERPVAYGRPEIEEIREPRLRAGRRLIERDPRVSRQLRVVDGVDIRGRS